MKDEIIAIKIEDDLDLSLLLADLESVQGVKAAALNLDSLDEVVE